jgi:hypothetical protein
MLFNLMIEESEPLQSFLALRSLLKRYSCQAKTSFSTDTPFCDFMLKFYRAVTFAQIFESPCPIQFRLPLCFPCPFL